jgi:hypothetical protein
MTDVVAKDKASSGGGSSYEEEEEDEALYEVERVLAHRERGDTYQYLIKWKNFPPSANTWEPQGNLSCLELINAYWDSRQERPAAFVRSAALARPDGSRTGGPAIVTVLGASRTTKGFVYKVQMQDGKTFTASSEFMRAKFPRMIINFFEAHRRPDDRPDKPPDPAQPV